jgi:hypothetical protein
MLLPRKTPASSKSGAIVVARERVAIVATDDRDALAIAEGEGVRVAYTLVSRRYVSQESLAQVTSDANLLPSLQEDRNKATRELTAP